jgi:hypothetical protein
VAGRTVNADGVLEPAELDPAPALDQVRRELDAASTADDWTRWGRWFLAEPAHRTISPFSRIVVSDFAEERVKELTKEAQVLAEQLAYGNDELLRRLSEVRAHTEQQFAARVAEQNKAAATNQGNVTGKIATRVVNSVAFRPGQVPDLLRRDPQAPATTIDLSGFYNVDPVTSWTDLNPNSFNSLASLPQGIQTLSGVQFDIRGIIQLSFSSSYFGPFPQQVTGIKIDQRCRRLHLLHAVCRSGISTNGTEVARFIFHQSGLPAATMPIRFGFDVRDWWVMPSQQLKGADPATVVWTGQNQHRIPLQLFKSTWQNPHPEVTVDSLDYISTMSSAAPFLVAVTVEP